MTADWRALAACRNAPDTVFFPGGRKPGPKDYAAARKYYCSECPVVTPCLLDALRMEAGRSVEQRHGFWGNTTPEQRYRLSRGETR